MGCGEFLTRRAWRREHGAHGEFGERGLVGRQDAEIEGGFLTSRPQGGAPGTEVAVRRFARGHNASCPYEEKPMSWHESQLRTRGSRGTSAALTPAIA